MIPTFVNLTPHPIVLILPSGKRLTFPPSGVRAQAETAPAKTTTIEVDGEWVEVVVAPPYERISGLPAYDPNAHCFYLVSAVAAEAVRGRPDVLIPATGPSDNPERDAQGQVVAVRQFRRLTAG